ncbi:MAG: hypothetical protein ACFFCW_02195 [Candidatus Hodarchaeota archaeon]
MSPTEHEKNGAVLLGGRLSLPVAKELFARLPYFIEEYSLSEKLDLIHAMLGTIKALVPHRHGTQAKNTLQRSFDGISNILGRNSLETWILPAPCEENLTFFSQAFTWLQLLDWSFYVTGRLPGSLESNIGGVLSKCKYVFITWDLSKLSNWDWFSILCVGQMLEPLARMSITNRLLVHRLIFINKEELETGRMAIVNQEKLFVLIWLAYFYEHVNLTNPQYLVSFVDRAKAERVMGIKAGGYPKHFDVALFSFDDFKIRKTGGSHRIIPTIQDSPTLGYDITQYTARTDPSKLPYIQELAESSDFLHLYITEKEGEKGMADDIIKGKVSKTRLFVDGLQQLESTQKQDIILDSWINTKSKQFFRLHPNVVLDLGKRYGILPVEMAYANQRDLLVQKLKQDFRALEDKGIEFHSLVS